MDNIILIGFMGTGKSTVSRNLSRMLKWDEIDTDQMLSEQEGKSIPEIFEQNGEAYFREKETELLVQLQNSSHTIISCGGGMAMRKENAEHMKKAGKVILLTATPLTIFNRVKEGRNRPLLNDNMSIPYIENLLEERRERYFDASDYIVSTDFKSVREICLEILDQLNLENL